MCLYGNGLALVCSDKNLQHWISGTSGMEIGGHRIGVSGGSDHRRTRRASMQEMTGWGWLGVELEEEESVTQVC